MKLTTTHNLELANDRLLRLLPVNWTVQNQKKTMNTQTTDKFLTRLDDETIRSPGGRIICTMDEAPCDRQRAEKQLIVRAVNEHAALTAVAEAAKKAQTGLSNLAINRRDGCVQTSADSIQDEANALADVLANLAAVRAQK